MGPVESPTPQCPAARELAGPPIGGPSVVCGVLLRETGHEDGITLGDASPLVTSGKDPSIYHGFCTGCGIPSVTGEPNAAGRLPRHYTACSIWQQEKQRIWEAAQRAWTPIDRYVQPQSAEDWLERTTA